jgi:putative peptide zinc metalloprotease protein
VARMTVLPSTPGRPGDARSPGPVASPSEILRLAEGVQLIGETAGSGYRQPPSLVRRADGQTIQLTPLLYLVLSHIDGTRTVDEVAARVSEGFGRTVTPDNVRTLVDRQLRPVGLLVRPDGSQPEVRKSDPLLGLRFRYAVTDPERTRRLTEPFARLFHPLVVTVVLAAFLGVCWWVLVEQGLASATYEAFDKPGLLLLVFVVTVLSAGFHEFGHAAAARRGGATPGKMGAGVYLVWPAFYTDVTDSYRLGKGGRVRTDLGGLYFNAIVAVAVAGVWWATGYDALLLVVATQILQMVRQLLPLVRFDGYHVLADLTGVPDLFQRIGPTLLGLLPWRWGDPKSTVLKPWARAVVSLWVLIVVPVLAFSLFIIVITLPRLLGTAWANLGKQAGLTGRAWLDGDLLEVAARALAIVALAFPVLAIGMVLARLVHRILTTTWRRTTGKPLRRALAGLVAVVVIAGLAWTWWPRTGTYRPVQPYEGGTLVQAVSAVTSGLPPLSPAGATPTGLVEGQHGRMVTAWPDENERPTREKPKLALVLVPRGYDPSAGGTTSGTSPDTPPPPGSDAGAGTDPAGGAAGGEPAPPAHPWVFPFDRPLQPGEGDNQALAVNTDDNTVAYDVAFALVWVEGDVPALNRNEAYAFASCTGCAAVAVGFQVVLVVGENHIAAPQNIAAAVNYDCVNCLTYALAAQLFVTLDGPLSDAGMAELTALWEQIEAFGTQIPDVPLSEIQARLDDFERQILQIIEKDQGPLTGQPTPAIPSGAAEPAERAPGDSTTSSTPGPARGPASPDGASSAPSPEEDGTPTGGGGTDGDTGDAGTRPDGSTQPSPAEPSPAEPTSAPMPPSTAEPLPG